MLVKYYALIWLICQVCIFFYPTDIAFGLARTSAMVADLANPIWAIEETVKLAQ
jgi:hypothetical protein